MANPFLIEPANPLQALMMGQQGYKTGKEYATEARRTNALSQLMGTGQQAGGTPDYAGVARTLAASGDLTGATQIAGLNKALAGPEQTDEIKEYNLSKAQGYKGSFTDWKTALKTAGATRVNTNVTTGDNAYAKTINEARAKDAVALQTAGRNALNTIGTLNRMEALTSDPNFYSGAGAEKLVLPFKQSLAALGGDPNSAAPMEEFRALSNKAALDGLGGSLGTGFSNADRDFITTQYPGLPNTPEGNKVRIDGLRKVEQRKAEIAKRARDYARRNKGMLDEGFDDELAVWAERNPIFPRAAPAAPRGAAPQGNRTGTGVPWRIVQ
jgi:hypothetical protein